MQSPHIANEQIIDSDSGKVLFEAGDEVPEDDAVRLGLIKRRARRPARNTARHHEDDRAIHASEDR